MILLKGKLVFHSDQKNFFRYCKTSLVIQDRSNQRIMRRILRSPSWSQSCRISLGGKSERDRTIPAPRPPLDRRRNRTAKRNRGLTRPRCEKVNGLTGQSLETSSSSSCYWDRRLFSSRFRFILRSVCTFDLVVVSTVRMYTISFPRYSTMYVCKYIQPRIWSKDKKDMNGITRKKKKMN